MFQSVIKPNGLICHQFGPLEARRHESSLLEQGQDPYVIYEDPAYPVSRHILSPFRGAQLTPAMSAVRTSVEWGYGKRITYFAFFAGYTASHNQTGVLKYPIYSETHVPFIHFTMAKVDCRITL